MKEQQRPNADKTAKSANLGQKEARAEKRSEEELHHMGELSGQKERKKREGMSNMTENPSQPKNKINEK